MRKIIPHNFPPLVLIYRYKPLPSFSLNGFSAGLVFLICRSFNFIFTVFFRYRKRYRKF